MTTNRYTVTPLLFKGKPMTPLFNRLSIIAVFIFGQSAAQAHNPDGTVTSVFHFITSPDHLSLTGFLALALCCAALRLKDARKARTVKLEKLKTDL